MTKHRQRRISRADYQHYKANSNLPPVKLPAERWGFWDWAGFVCLSFIFDALLLWALLEGFH
jgi:hypothetical protein